MFKNMLALLRYTKHFNSYIFTQVKVLRLHEPYWLHCKIHHKNYDKK